MTPRVAAKIKQLVADGATVVGPKPTRSPSLSDYPACDQQVRADCRRTVGRQRRQDGDRAHVRQRPRRLGRALQQVLGDMNVRPDFTYESHFAAKLVYIHRVVDDTDIYFVSNQGGQPQAVTCSFRIAGRAPQLWHPESGAIAPAPLYTEAEGRTRRAVAARSVRLGVRGLLCQPRPGRSSRGRQSSWAPGNDRRTVLRS